LGLVRKTRSSIRAIEAQGRTNEVSDPIGTRTQDFRDENPTS
jgi:hypothetical protein